MPECPYCGKWFKTKKGLQQHIAKVHSMKLPDGRRVINPLSIDPLGKMEREMERAKRRQRRKKRSDPFLGNIEFPDIFGDSKKKRSSKKRGKRKKKSGFDFDFF